MTSSVSTLVEDIPDSKYDPVEIRIENDNVSKILPHGLKEDRTLAWWSVRSLQIQYPGGSHRILVRPANNTEGENINLEENTQKGDEYVVVVKCCLQGWIARPLERIVDKLMVPPKGWIHRVLRRLILKFDWRNRQRGRTMFLIEKQDTFPKDWEHGR